MGSSSQTADDALSTLAIVDFSLMPDPVVAEDGPSTDAGSSGGAELPPLASVLTFDGDLMLDDGFDTAPSSGSTSGTGASTGDGSGGFESLGSSDLAAAVDPGAVECAA